MRRALLTAGTAPAALSVGLSTGGSASSTPAARRLYSKQNPATATGTLTTASVNGPIGGLGTTICFFTIDPGAMTIRAISGTVSVGSSGLQSYGISLAVVAGDYIGCALVTAGTSSFNYSVSGGTAGFNYDTTVGTTVTVGMSVAGWTSQPSPALLVLSAAG